MFDSLQPLGPQHARPPGPSLSSGVCPSSCPLNLWCYPTISTSAALFSIRLQSFPGWVSLPKSGLFTLGGQNTGASALGSVFPKNIQSWFPLVLIGLISLQSKGLSRVFSSTTIQSINSSVLSLLYGLSLTIIHDYWKNHSFDYMYRFQQSEVSAF